TLCLLLVDIAPGVGDRLRLRGHGRGRDHRHRRRSIRKTARVNGGRVRLKPVRTELEQSLYGLIAKGTREVRAGSEPALTARMWPSGLRKARTFRMRCCVLDRGEGAHRRKPADRGSWLL